MLKKTLKEIFGFSEFREGQEQVIENIQNGKSTAAIFPTGSGKSLCYQLSSLLLPHITLVISPLLALIQDQLDYMQSIGLSAVRIDSTLSKEQEKEVIEGLRSGKHKVLMISVERFKNERFRKFLSEINISLMVIDEAHCISEWGHNFRPDYLKLPIYKKEFNIPQTLLLTATATPKVVQDMCNKFQLDKEDIVLTGFYRKNLNITIKPVSFNNKNITLSNILAKNTEEASIIYVTLQKTAENVSLFLNRNGINSKAYHAGLGNDKREEIQNLFMSGQCQCIVATIAFGMGIDKKDIRKVIHYDLPKSIENYSQEIGRAGRDGNNSDCIVLANANNINTLENFVYGDTPEQSAIETLLNRIPFNEKSWDIKMTNLSSRTNIRLLPLKTLLVYLEMKGIIKPAYSYFASYRYSNIKTDEDIINMFSGERKEFISTIFKESKKARKWSTLDFKSVYQKYNSSRERIVAALEFFDEKGLIQLEAKEMKESFSILQNNVNISELAKSLYLFCKEKEASEIDRIQKMIAFFQNDKCLSKQLASYFGEELDFDNCGHCSVCKNGAITMPKDNQLSPLQNINREDLCSEFIAKFEERPSNDLITRFLCGITVPSFTKIKAKGLKSYGTLSEYRYNEVIEWLS